ncbi:hypothetical protein DB44_DF00020, partial [Candidatus Protochlamydia amoebophila]
MLANWLMLNPRNGFIINIKFISEIEGFFLMIQVILQKEAQRFLSRGSTCLASTWRLFLCKTSHSCESFFLFPT